MNPIYTYMWVNRRQEHVIAGMLAAGWSHTTEEEYPEVRFQDEARTSHVLLKIPYVEYKAICELERMLK